MYLTGRWKQGRTQVSPRGCLDDAGALRRFVNMYVGDEDVRFSDGLATPDCGRRETSR